MENSSNLPHEKQCPLDLTLGGAMEYETKHMHGRLFNDPNVDLKKIRRTISNRLSAQRSRARMVNYTSDLEKRVKDLKELISILTSQVESYIQKKKLLVLKNCSLRPELEKRANESRRLQMEIEEMRAEIKMLIEPEKTSQKKKLAFQFEPLKIAEYPSITFYQSLLQNQQKNPSPAAVLEVAPDTTIEQSDKEINQVDLVEKKDLGSGGPTWSRKDATDFWKILKS